MCLYRAEKRSIFIFLFSLFLFSLSSCSKQSKNLWTTDFVLSENTAKNSSLLFYEPPFTWNRLSLEAIRSEEGISLYILASSVPFKSENKETAIRIQRPSLFWEGKAFILKGDHKALLPPEATDFILQGLQHGETIEITIGFQKLVVEPSNFAIKYRRFLNVPLKTPLPKQLN